jgi:hypothetical protein
VAHVTLRRHPSAPAGPLHGKSRWCSRQALARTRDKGEIGVRNAAAAGAGSGDETYGIWHGKLQKKT